MKNKKNPRPRIVQCGTWILACLFSGNSPARHPRQNARQAALRRFADSRGGGDTRSTYGGVLRRFIIRHDAAQHNVGGNWRYLPRFVHVLYYTTVRRRMFTYSLFNGVAACFVTASIVERLVECIASLSRLLLALQVRIWTEIVLHVPFQIPVERFGIEIVEE